MAVKANGGLAITLPWGDADRTFRLRIGEWRKIEARTGAGPEELAARLSPSVNAIENNLPVAHAAALGMVGRWRVDDVREVILQGLLGGDPDLGPVGAATLVNTWVDERPLRENVQVAFAIVMASIAGVAEDRDLGEPKGEADPTPTRSPTDGFDGGTSTAAAPAPVSVP